MDIEDYDLDLDLKDPEPPRTGKRVNGFADDYEDERVGRSASERNMKPVRPEGIVKSIREILEVDNFKRKDISLPVQVRLILKERDHWKRIASKLIAENQRLRENGKPDDGQT